MEQNYFKEIFEYPIEEFKAHLSDSSNRRVLFSGKYGIGKTRFLQNFFSKECQESVFGSVGFRTYTLYPVNYSIASNEDIIRYIKYDIILEMLRNGISIDEVRLSYLDTLPQYLRKDIDKVLATVVKMIPNLGKEISGSFEKIVELRDFFLKYHSEVSTTAGDKLIEYLEKIQNAEGGVYENDIVTKIISENILRKDNEESILIIDDIDRLDPEHVFRILNVFASHFDVNTNTNGNKFNFSKIILVCDINNIRSIFHHRYGADVDFSGYIDKFFSNDVFCFDNLEPIRKNISRIFQAIKFTDRESANMAVLRDTYFKDGFLSSILECLVTQGFTSLRGLIKLRGRTFDFHDQSVCFDGSCDEIAWRYPVLLQLKILREILGDFHNIRSTIQRTKFDNFFLSQCSSKFAEFIQVFSLINGEDCFKGFSYRGTGIWLSKKPSSGSWRQSYEVKIRREVEVLSGGTQIDSDLYNVDSEAFRNVIIDTIECLNKVGWLK